VASRNPWSRVCELITGWQTRNEPDAPQSDLPERGISDEGDFNVAMAQTHKSVELLTDIVDFVVATNHLDWDTSTRALASLLDEPELQPAHLLAMTRLLPGRERVGAKLLTAVCQHRLARADTLLEALWHAPQDVARTLAGSTRHLTIAAIAWERRHAAPAPNLYRAASTSAAVKIRATTSRWEDWADNDPARVTWLLNSSFEFAAEDEATMFAVGAALLAAPHGS